MAGAFSQPPRHRSLWVMAGDSHSVAVKTLKLVSAKERQRRVWLAAVLVGFQPSHIGHVVVSEMCGNYMEDCPASKLWQSGPRPARPHVCSKLKRSRA